MAETVKKAKTPAKPRKTASKKTMASTAPASISIHTPSHEQIAELARKYWAERGYTDGQHEQDWFRAEQELRAKAS
jgi:hypothetical protein